MRQLLTILGLLLFSLNGLTQSPHGDGFKIDCASCHTSQDWKMIQTAMSFDHNTTKFSLTGQHLITTCISCHKTLKFQEAKSECISCHTDMHSNTLGTDCARCHLTNSWIIENTTAMHEQSRFPLQGNHAVIDCASCHKSSSNYQYEPLGIECIDCHKTDYLGSTNPNHQTSHFPTNCTQCHEPNPTNWKTSRFEHDAFPLTGGHSIDCAQCHKDGSFQRISNECISCHQVQYNNAKSHVSSKFSTDCTSCHTSTTWTNTTFDHSNTNFQLTGSHTKAECASCHKTSTSGTSSECSACHSSNFNNAQSPDHTKAGIPADCKSCHSTTSWQPSSFNHSTTGFTLTGGHAAIVQCSDCHLGSVTTAKQECISCHQVQYNNARGHVASKFPTDCAMCHNSNSWLENSFNHANTNFPLTGSHIPVECASCHTTGYAGTSTECSACHSSNFNNAQTPNHTKAGIPNDCKSCHTTASWQPSSFNHSTTGFTLTGGHAAIVQCSDCHLGSVTTAKQECISCHQVQYNNARGHVASKFPTDCAMCHNSNSWLENSFNHANTNFPLTGSHTTVECASCHTTGYAGTSTECSACHSSNFNNAQTPNHTKAGIPNDCKSCHTTASWQPSSFNHSTTGFTLTGGHAAIVQCSDCHLGSVTTAKQECISCHQVQYNNAPEHLASKFPTDCTMCHNPNSWLENSFNHANTNFPLTGSHIPVECASCHTAGYAGTSTECSACHSSNFNNAQTPNHTKAGIPNDCKSCHTTTSWQPSSFNHSTTGFNLTGGHAAIVQCSDCHLGSTTTASQECISCHQVQYNNAPGHVASKFPTDCTMCHNPNSWLENSFNHTNTNFPLTGSHIPVECASCHTAGYAGTSTECSACHSSNFNNAQTPNHTKAGIPNDCKSCHSTTSWQPSSFNHSTTGFTLTGGHAAIVQCSDCHLGSVTTAKQECISCHQVQYNNARGHVASKFPTDCATCHNSNSWLENSFNHANTNFPLTGSHTTVECASCHTTGYAGTSTECSACHQTNYNQTTNPNHNTLSLPVTCIDCHTTNPNWQPASFPIHNNYFTLSGAHAVIANDCAACHNGVYTNTSKTCYTCHTDDYNNTTNPAHKTAQFPIDCTSCHSVNAWSPSTFNHDSQYFPIYSGNHRGQWKLCSECHTSPSNFSAFSCIICHEHNNKTSVDSDHSGVRNYTYTATSCYSCHPQGRD